MFLPPDPPVHHHPAEDPLPGRGRVQGPDHLPHGLTPQQRPVPGRQRRVVRRAERPGVGGVQ